MEKVVIINLHNSFFDEYFNLFGMRMYNCENKLIQDTIKLSLHYNGEDHHYTTQCICPGVNIIISDYEFISPILEEKSNDYFVELCIKPNEFKFYNFDNDSISDEFDAFDENNELSKEYYLLIYRFLLATLDNKPNIKSALN